MTEATLTRQISEALRNAGAWVYKTHGSALTRAGAPDLLVCYKGHFFGLEVKLPGRAGTALQWLELRRISKAGGTALIVRSMAEAKGIMENTNLLVTQVLEHHIKEAIELIEQALTERWEDQPATLRAALDTLHLGADER